MVPAKAARPIGCVWLGPKRQGNICLDGMTTAPAWHACIHQVAGVLSVESVLPQTMTCPPAPRPLLVSHACAPVVSEPPLLGDHHCQGLEKGIIKPAGSPWRLLCQIAHGPPSLSPLCCAGEESDRVLRDVEAQFVAGLRRKDGRTVGLGL